MGADGHGLAGKSAFRAFLRSLPDDVARAREDGLPVVLRRDRPLPVHAQRLMDALGVEVVVTAIAHELVTCPIRACSWTWVGDATKSDPYVQSHLKLMHGSHRMNGSDSAASPEVEKPEEPTVGSRQSMWTREAVVDAMQRWSVEEGRTPSQSDWKSRGEWWPSFSTAARLFGSWGEALKAAGLEPTRAGRRSASPEREPQEEAPAAAVPATPSAPAFGRPAPSRSEDAEPTDPPPSFNRPDVRAAGRRRQHDAGDRHRPRHARQTRAARRLGVPAAADRGRA